MHFVDSDTVSGHFDGSHGTFLHTPQDTQGYLSISTASTLSRNSDNNISEHHRPSEDSQTGGKVVRKLSKKDRRDLMVKHGFQATFVCLSECL